MVCKTCGGQLNPNDKFCRYCGTTVPASQEAPVQNQEYVYAAPQAPRYPNGYNPAGYTQGQNGYAPNQYGYAQNQNGCEAPVHNGVSNQGFYQAPMAESHTPKYAAPQKPKKPGKKWLLIGGIAAAAVLVIVLVAVLLFSGNPAAKVGSAMAATGKEMTQLSKTVDVAGISKFLDSEAMSHDLEIKIDTLSEGYFSSDAALLQGVGLRTQLDTNLKKREAGLRLVPSYGSVDICNLMLAAEDDMIYFALPEILSDSFGLSTETMMADLEAMGADVGEAAQISFNIFEMIELVQTRMEDSEAYKKEMEKAVAQLLKSVEVEKEGKSNIRINGRSTKCSAYTVTIPQQALEDLIWVAEDMATAVDYMDIMEELLDSMNLPADIVDELLYEMQYAYTTPDFSSVYDLLDILGDVELEVYVSSGKVSAIVYEEEIEGTELELGLYIGGKEAYIDEISFEMIVDGEGFTVVSQGDHGARDGVFTDETTITFDIPGMRGDVVVLETEYDPKSDYDNLSLRMKIDEITFRMEGTYVCEKNQLQLAADTFAITSDGVDGKIVDLSFSYTVGNYQKRVDMAGARLLSDLTEDDLMEIVAQAEEKAKAWAMGLVEQIPDLMYLF